MTIQKRISLWRRWVKNNWLNPRKHVRRHMGKYADQRLSNIAEVKRLQSRANEMHDYERVLREEIGTNWKKMRVDNEKWSKGWRGRLRVALSPVAYWRLHHAPTPAEQKRKYLNARSRLDRLEILHDLFHHGLIEPSEGEEMIKLYREERTLRRIVEAYEKAQINKKTKSKK